MLYCERRQAAAAERELAKALAILEPLAARFPNVADLAHTLAGSQLLAGNVARDLRGQPEAARVWYTKVVERCEAVLKREPREQGARTYLQWSASGRARCLHQLGRHAEALADWRRVLEVDGGKGLSYRAGYARGLAAAGDRAAAVAEADAVSPSRELAADACCELAAAYALVARDLGTDPRAEGHAARAVALLGRAKAAGHFQVPHQWDWLRTEKDLEPLRGRQDFRSLLEALRPPDKQ
jgi:tetratricopeptide (TPR) repeat protein